MAKLTLILNKIRKYVKWYSSENEQMISKNTVKSCFYKNVIKLIKLNKFKPIKYKYK